MDKLRTVAKSRLNERIDILSTDAASSVRHVITEVYGRFSASRRWQKGYSSGGLSSSGTISSILSCFRSRSEAI